MSRNNDLELQKFPQVVVVEASAGSGKTFALAKRYLKLLINPQISQEQLPLASILAITFTNKATLEMKERILELLKRVALDSFSNPADKKAILDLLGLEEKEARQVAKRIIGEIVQHYNSFQVKTIDSFINALLLGSALNIDRSANFKIKRDYREQLNFCLDLVIEQAPEDKQVLKILEEFLDHYLFVENRKGWFPKEDILGLMHSLFTLSNKFGGLFQVYPGKSLEVIKMKRNIHRKIEHLVSLSPEGLNARVFKSLATFLERSKDIFDIADLPQSLSSVKPPLNKSATASKEFVREWRQINKQLVELIELDSTVAYNPYVGLFHKLLDFFQVISKKEDVLFLEELNRKARLLFDQEGLTVAEVYYRLATRFRHYLVDEFQDTSFLQWRNLEMMIEEALSTGGSLFYVGDKKQAIYRFRGGESGLFDQIKHKFSRYNVIPTQLTNNWRSQKAIIDFNNQVFASKNLVKALSASGINEALAGDSSALDEITSVFKDAHQQGKAENCRGYVSIERLDEKNQQQRNEIMQPKIISLVKELKTRFRYEDIAILTRNNAEVELVSAWLLSEKIPVESEKTLNVIENNLIKEIICLLRFLHSPIDDLSFIGFILGEIFTKTSNLSVETIREFIFKLHSEGKLNQNISFYRQFAKAYPKIWSEYFEDFFQKVGFISVYELVTAIYSRFRIFDQFPKHEAFFMKFLELVKQSQEEYVGIGEFLDYLKNASLDDLYVTITHSDSVKVLTVHKSKGLEFPVVIVPFLRIEISPESGAKGTNSYVLDDQSQNLGLVRITKAHRLFSDKLQKIYAQSYKKACIDELNNIYVALTRPQQELYIFIPKKSGSSVNKVFSFIPEGLTKLGSQEEYAQPKKDTSQPMVDISHTAYQDWIKALTDEDLDRSEVLNRERILAGNIIHALMGQIGNCFKKDIESMLKPAIASLTKIYPHISDFSQYQDKAKEILKKPELKDIFYLSDGEVFCEKEVVDLKGNLKRVDRLIITKDKVIVVDYKNTAIKTEAHQEQLRQYLEIFSAIYPKKKLKGLLIYLEPFSLEEIKP